MHIDWLTFTPAQWSSLTEEGWSMFAVEPYPTAWDVQATAIYRVGSIESATFIPGAQEGLVSQ